MPSHRRSEAEKASIKQGGGKISRKNNIGVKAQKGFKETNRRRFRA
jgi:hypothetical protein